MTDAEIRLQCLHLAFKERKAMLASGALRFPAPDWLERAEEMRRWVVGDAMPAGAMPNTPGAPETSDTRVYEGNAPSFDWTKITEFTASDGGEWLKFPDDLSPGKVVFSVRNARGDVYDPISGWRKSPAPETGPELPEHTGWAG